MARRTLIGVTITIFLFGMLVVLIFLASQEKEQQLQSLDEIFGMIESISAEELPSVTSKRPLNVDLKNPGLNLIIPKKLAENLLPYEFVTKILFQKVNKPVNILLWDDFGEDPSTWKAANQSIIISSLKTTFGVRSSHYFSHLRQAGYNHVALFHVNDVSHQASLASYPHVDFVLRQFYFDDVFKAYENAFWVPLGFSSDFARVEEEGRVKEASKRGKFCFFQGQRSQEREEVREEISFSSQEQCQILLNADFSIGASKEEFVSRICDSVFVPALFGKKEETLHFYEALECGAIPIVKKTPFFEGLLQGVEEEDHPFVMVEDWKQAGEFVRQSFERVKEKGKEELDQRQLRARKWWSQLKEKHQSMIAKLVKPFFEE